MSADTVAVRTPRLLVAAAGCAIIVVVLAVLVRTRWDPLQGLDTDLGTPAELWSYRHPAAVGLLVVIEVAFGTIATTSYLLVLVAVLWVRGYRRTVGWVVAVMAGASLTTTLLKVSFHRRRPVWVDPVRALSSFSFPSGHASGVASGMGVVAVLVLVYVRRPAVRAVLLTLAATAVVVVGADRILLGVHNLSDVVAGYAVGTAWVLIMLALYPPDRPHEPLPTHEQVRGR